MDFEPSQKSSEMLAKLKSFIEENIAPVEEHLITEIRKANNTPDWTKWTVIPEISALKQKAKEAGLWNLFLPDDKLGQGLTTLEYAPLAEEMGRYPLAPEIFNCNAPDTGNMEVLYHFGNQEQKDRWLKPLLEGEIRSVFCMTEPGVASSDATNMAATAVLDGDEVVINGKKWWSTGLGHPDAKISIFMGLSDPDGEKYMQHSMVLVPFDTPGVKIERMLPVFNEYDPPYGHGEVLFDNVRVPKANIISGLGHGFYIAQGRLGPGRIHHCMRALGLAERTLEIMINRAKSREAFGKQLIKLGANGNHVAQARIDIDQARLLTLYAAWKIDKFGVKSAMSEISAIKVVVPNILQRIIDQAIQIHGGAGLSQDVPLTDFYLIARSLRLADGPDEVHLGSITREELKKYRRT